MSSFSHKARHGARIDGSLFAMTLMYALHDLGLGACPLNTSYTIFEERKLRKEINLSFAEEPIMMIGIGHLKDKFVTANSPKKDIKEILFYDE